MNFTNTLIKGKLVKRYKRFFTDIEVNNKIVTAHCPNTGSMKGLLDEGNEVWISPQNDPSRKLKFTLELIKVKKKLVGVNTHRANRIVQHGLENKLISEFKSTKNIKPEFKYSPDTRFDFLCDKSLLEVKNVTLISDDEVAEFPDAVTTRGKKHLVHLQDAIRQGYESYLLFLIQREDPKSMKIANDIDPEYFKEIKKAKKNGVKILAYSCKVKENEISVNRNIKVSI